MSSVALSALKSFAIGESRRVQFRAGVLQPAGGTAAAAVPNQIKPGTVYSFTNFGCAPRTDGMLVRESKRVNVRGVVPIDQLRGDSESETLLPREMAEEARACLLQFQWCIEVADLQFGAGIGGVVAVLLARIVPRGSGIDEWLWTVVGDLAPAYLVTDDSPSPAAALRAYVEEMERWVSAVRKGEAVDDLIPVNAQCTQEAANALESRLNFLKTRVIPLFADTAPADREIGE